MKNNLSIIVLLIFAIVCSSLSNAQSIYKNKKDYITENKNVQGNNTKNIVSIIKFDKKHSLKANLISPFFNILTVFYNRYLTEETAIQFGASIMTDCKFNTDNDERNLNSQAITAEYRYLLIGSHANGSYIQPFARFINANASVSLQKEYFDNTLNKWVNKKINYNESCVSAGLGFLLGFQNTVKNKLLFDVYAGPAYAIQFNPTNNRPSDVAESNERGSLKDLLVKGYGIRAGFCIGFLF